LGISQIFFTALYISLPDLYKFEIFPSYDTNSTSGLVPDPPSHSPTPEKFVLLVVKFLIRPATSLKFVHLALRSKRLDTPAIVHSRGKNKESRALREKAEKRAS